MSALPTPYGNRVLVKRVRHTEQKLASGLLVVQHTEDAICRGEIVAVGTKLNEELKVGDKVLYLKYSAAEIEALGEKLDLILVEDLLAVEG